MATVNVRLKNRNLNVRAYGFDFDGDGICNVEKDEIQSLIDAKKVIVVKDLKANKSELKSLAGVDDEDGDED